MEAGELKLELWLSEATWQIEARLSDAVPAPERRLTPRRWQPRGHSADWLAALDAFEKHPGPVRLAVSFRDHDRGAVPARTREALERRPDALFVYAARREPLAPRPQLSLPLRCIGLEGQAGPRFDEFATWASENGLLAREVISPHLLPHSTPHVLHLAPDWSDYPWVLVSGESSFTDLVSFRPPPLVVLEWTKNEVDDRELRDWVWQLVKAGCGAILVVRAGTAPGGIDEAVSRAYRKIAHDRPLDWVARDLIRRGHGALLVLNGEDDADTETGVSLRRAVLEQRRQRGLRAEDALRWQARPATSELEGLLAERAAAAAAELAKIAREVDGLNFEHEEHAVRQLGRESERIDAVMGDAAHALDWSFGRPATRPSSGLESYDPGETAAMPARALRAVLRRGEAMAEGGAREEELKGGVLEGEGFALDVSIDFVGRIRKLKLPGVNEPIALETLARAFGGDEAIEIELTVWAPAEHFEVRCEAPRLLLPRMGESGKARFELKALGLPPGADEAVRRLRVAAYHRNRLLQSLVVDVVVGREKRPGWAPEQSYDYAVSDELLAVGEGPVRRLSLFVNSGAEGTHWIGARTQGASAAHGVPIALDTGGAAKVTDMVHAMLREASELDRGDRYAAPLAEIDEGDRADRERRLVDLALAGHKMFTVLFASSEGLNDLRAALGPPDGHVEIARCRGDAPALPWQLVYDLPLAVRDKRVALCPSYLGQLGHPGDLLDRPGECANQPCCPHRQALGKGGAAGEGAPEPELTVCPFGFWGSRHKMAQPLSGRRHDETVPTRKPSGRRGVTIGYFSFENASTHVGQIAQVAAPGQVLTQSVATLRKYLTGRNDAIIYLYCHGKTIDDEFVLQLGEDDETSEYLGASELVNLTSGSWPGWSHGPVVILNGCKTLQVRPTSLNELLGVIRNLGASAIVGPEIEMFTTSAAKIGESIVIGALERVPLDELMMRIRRGLLRELSPMGLAYNVYAPSGLAWSPP